MGSRRSKFFCLFKGLILLLWSRGDIMRGWSIRRRGNGRKLRRTTKTRIMSKIDIFLRLPNSEILKGERVILSLIVELITSVSPLTFSITTLLYLVLYSSLYWRLNCYPLLLLFPSFNSTALISSHLPILIQLSETNESFMLYCYLQSILFHNLMW